jgi:hypothetical protein
MQTIFDVLTVTCFAALVLAYLQFTSRALGTLMHLMISGVAFAVANQIGNAGQPIFAVILVVAGVGYAIMVVKREGS